MVHAVYNMTKYEILQRRSTTSRSVAPRSLSSGDSMPRIENKMGFAKEMKAKNAVYSYQG